MSEDANMEKNQISIIELPPIERVEGYYIKTLRNRHIFKRGILVLICTVTDCSDENVLTEKKFRELAEEFSCTLRQDVAVVAVDYNKKQTKYYIIDIDD